jgi:hypothetical protein
MKKIFFLGLFITSFSFFGQQKLNNYKYVVVANKFDFLKKADEYQTSSLTKFLFTKYGYTAFLSTEEFPEDLRANKCSSLFASINDASGVFTIKVNLTLKDCRGKVIYTSSLGRTKEKNFKKGFHEAIRNAFKDPVIKNYSYKPQAVIPNNVVKVTASPKVKEAAVINTANANIIIGAKVQKAKNIVVGVLYAQVTNNGFQLVDTVPKVIFKILKTQQENIFIIEDKNGVLYKKNAIWIAEFYENGKRIQKEYQIRF